MCTAEEAEQLRADLTAAIEALRAETKQNMDQSSSRLRTELMQVVEEASQTANTAKAAADRAASDSKAFTETSTENMRKKMADMLSASEAKTNGNANGLDQKIQQVDSSVRTALAEELAALCEQIDQQMQQQRQELEDQAQKWAREAAEEIVRQRQEVDLSILKVREEAEARREETYHKTLQDLEKRAKEIHNTSQDSVDRARRAEAEVYLKLGTLQDDLQGLEKSAREHAEQVQRGAAAQLQEFREVAEGKMDHLDEETTRLRDVITEVENLSTRRVDWVIRRVSQLLRPPSASKATLHTSWFSPKFNMAGAHGLQLEFQLFRPSDPPVEGEGAGDCAVFLWACKGTSLVYRLYIGKKVANLEKVFNGRVPYGTKRLCFLKDQINREDDTLRISVEILESVREMEHPVAPPAPPTDIDELELSTLPVEGMMVFRRHINNRIFDQVKKEVESMRSRMVRRIEWRVEQASLLRKCFPPGESMCSAAFNAAGIDGMQLMFYPCGYNGAGEGMCSVYIFAPAGTTLKCALYAGSQRRDASHYFEEPGAFGRTNFCRFDSAVDADEDTITLALDVEEAHQDVQASVSHPTVQPGDRRSQGQMDGDLPDKVESVVKLKRVPGKTPPGMEEKRILPNLWMAQSLSSEPPPDGYKTYEDIKKVTSKQGSPVVGSITSVHKSESSPTLRSLRESESTPLPSLTRTAGNNDWAFDAASSLRLGRSGRGRKNRTLQFATTAH